MPVAVVICAPVRTLASRWSRSGHAAWAVSGERPSAANVCRATLRARRAGPREHGREAARSKRDRSCGHASWCTEPDTSAPPQAAHP
jgi:hypothetical protein